MTEPNAIDAYVIDVENLHHIQRDILARLYTVPTAAYADLKPADLTGNSFNYHLRHVLAQKLIEQAPDGNYRLSPQGRLLVDSVSLPSMRLKLRPVVGLTLVITSKAHGTLLYRSNREPTRGLVGLPFGKLRLGDSLDTTLQRMLLRRELDPSAANAIRALGLTNFRYFVSNELVSHRMASAWALNYDGPNTVNETSHGRSFWSQNPTTESDILQEVAALTAWPNGLSTLEITAELPR